MDRPYKPAPDIDTLVSNFPIPGYGLIPINAFVLKAAEPVLIDTGAVVESPEFMQQLRSIIDPQDLKWIWLTHTDFDHIGSLRTLLDEVPHLRLITSFLGVGIMSLSDPLPMDRLQFLNPGESMSVGDRTLTAVKPPVFDNPSTIGLYDDKSGALFSSDCFGAIMQDPAQHAEDMPADALREGQVFWATVDSPWLHKVDEKRFAKDLDRIRKIEPKMVLSSHLPAARGDMLDTLLGSLAQAPGAEPFVGPDQAGLEAMLKEMTEGATA